MILFVVHYLISYLFLYRNSLGKGFLFFIGKYKNKYVEIKEIEINDSNIETQELLEEESGKKYYRISMTSGKTYIIGK